jgi:DNA-directed RNA polymerase subunit beta'
MFPGDKIKKGDSICSWDPYNNVIINEGKGTVIKFEMIEEGSPYREELDEQTGFREIVITETKDKKKNPAILIMDKKGEVLKTYSTACGAHLSVKEGDKRRRLDRF